ncbi:hypothetical protein OIU34_02565 [Pararhizobium sp. BT-229]|uniref:hypothetical protein n=1 Tax=Pararhizobium sp. BT-229 TaxID=2986923 RepID=UPI0021F6F90A|nr:hypothetical protein [Pararhizobium sp. BT-229]MCV9960771.1 hypothetical protein [Pararhizobium sp. BT-229]
MNEFDGFAEPRRGGWWAMLRLARDAEAKPLLDKGGEPKVFGDELAATKAILEHTFKYFNGHLVRDGELAGLGDRVAARATANLVFRKGKAIKVERAGARKGA